MINQFGPIKPNRFFGEIMRKISFVLLMLVLFIISSCTDKYDPPNDTMSLAKGSGCVDCHTDKDLLKEVADPLPPPSGGGGEG